MLCLGIVAGQLLLLIACLTVLRLGISLLAILTLLTLLTLLLILGGSALALISVLWIP